MRACLLLCLSLLAGFLPAPGHAAAQPVVTVADPSLQMRTGPGQGYPIFHVVERGESVTILKRRTEWFKVRTDHDREGWVDQAQLEKTLQPDGEPVRFGALAFDDYAGRKWEMGALGGDFGGANVISLYGARHLTANLSPEGGISQLLCSVSARWLLTAHRG